MKNFIKKLNTLDIIIIIIVIASLLYLYLDKNGIKIGYEMNGGKPVQEEPINLDSLLKEYNESVETYELYKNSTNSTALSWAEKAKRRANEVADEYNSLVAENFLKRIED